MLVLSLYVYQPWYITNQEPIDLLIALRKRYAAAATASISTCMPGPARAATKTRVDAG